MKLSEVKNPCDLTLSQIHELVYGGVQDDGGIGEVAFLLGSRPDFSKSRALGASRLYKAGRVKYIVPSGGVKWLTDGEMKSEAEYMREILLSEGVPESAILLENNATTTRENMIFSTAVVERALRFEKVKSVVVVTSYNHLRRSMALANWLLPRHLTITGYPTEQIYPVEAMEKSKELYKLMTNEVRIYRDLIVDGLVDDIEFQ